MEPPHPDSAAPTFLPVSVWWPLLTRQNFQGNFHGTSTSGFCSVDLPSRVCLVAIIDAIYRSREELIWGGLKALLWTLRNISEDTEEKTMQSLGEEGGRWMQRSTMNGFLELESLESLNGRLSETGTWYEIFQQLAEQAARLDAVGNGTEAELFYHQCKLYLEKASEGDKDVAGSSNSLIALCWVYLALANFYRYNLMPDYWKAIEYLLLLLSTRAKVVSSSEGMVAPSYNEIRFALCLTMFEWVDVLEEFDQAAEMAVLNAVPLEEARGIVDEWKTLDDVEVASFLAYMLSLGYAKLQRNNRKSYWDQWLTDLKLQFVSTGDPFLVKIPKYPSVEFLQFSKKMKFCLQRFREFGAKAGAAKAAGQILAAEECFRQCIAIVRAAGDEFPISARRKSLGWAYENLARIYRLDLVDHSKAIECYRASLSEANQVHGGVDSTIGGLKLFIIEVMYERAYDAGVLLDVERQARLVAEAVLEARKILPEVFNGSTSDLDVENFFCFKMSAQYEEWGRVAEALFWNDERLKLKDKKDSCYEEIRLRSAHLLMGLGEHEKASKIVASVLKNLKKSSTQESTDAIRSLAFLPYTNRLKRDIYHRLIIENPESELPAMTTDVIEQEYKAEVEWAEQFLEIFKPSDDTKHEKPDIITKWNLQIFEGQQLMSDGKLEEAVACFHKGLELISEGGGDDMYRMGCLGEIGACHSLLFVSAAKVEVQCGAGAYPGNHDTNMAFMHHFHLSKDYLQSALKIAEQRDDIYSMAFYNKLLGFLLYTNWKLVLPEHDKLGKDGYNCLRTALNHFKASGRNLNRFLFGLRDINKLWISVLEQQDGVSMSAYYLIQRSIYEIIRGEYFKNQRIVSREYIHFSTRWGLQALLWAERGHSRSLAFKLSERNMGPSTRLELQRFDMDDWGEASASIKESRDVSGFGTVMLEFFKTEEEDKERFIIYSVTPDGGVRMQLSDKPETDLRILLKKLHDHMSQKPESNLSDQEVMQILEDLYEAFFSPIQLVLDDMEEHHKLVICANKILAGVPFAALRNPKTKKFLIERHTVVCTPSLRILKQCNKRLKTLQRLPLMESTGAALVLGDPAFSSARDRLIDSRKEANTITDILGRQNVLLLKGESALKKKVLEWAQLATSSGKYQALMHLATHGRADDTFKEGALQFADPKVRTWPLVPTPQHGHDMSNLSESQIKAFDESSSSTSSTSLQAQEEELVFCGRGHTGPRRAKLDPCHLTSEEIVKDQEWRMLLVVLSACETAKGEVKSEGTLNLARALLISGVPSTVVSQWKVEDASAPTLMEGMYRAMKLGSDVASALRASMMDLINKNYRVHQWAPFVVMGLGTVTLPETFLV